MQLEITSRQFKLWTRTQVRKNCRETFGNLTEVVRTGDLSKRRKKCRKERGRVGTEAILDPHPEVSWCWRRKRKRELTFTEAKIRSGNRVEKTENGNDPGTVITGSKSLGNLECRYVQQLDIQAAKGSSEQPKGAIYKVCRFTD